MSKDTANAERFEKGLTALTELEAELLIELERADWNICAVCRVTDPQETHCTSCIEREARQAAIKKAHGTEKGGE